MKQGFLALAAVAMMTALGATPVVAQSAAKAALAPDEVLLQISATGSSQNRADAITMLVPIHTSGESASAARAANKAKIESLKKALVAHGVEAGTVSLIQPQMPFGFVGNAAAFDLAEPDTSAVLAAAAHKKSAESLGQISLTDPAMVGAVREVVDAEDQGMAGAPVYALKDDKAARGAANADAIARARQQAEASAAALGMQVARITRVSNYGQPVSEHADYATVTRMMMGARGGAGDQVVTEARVWVDFILKPR
jgi:uncharacterized protein YggE